jgi:hypothetical protein
VQIPPRIPKLPNAASAGHRRGPYPRPRWFNSIGCDQRQVSSSSRTSVFRRAPTSPEHSCPGPTLDGYHGTENAGASPATCRVPPPFQGWDTILRRSLVEVRFLSVAPCGPMIVRYQTNNRSHGRILVRIRHFHGPSRLRYPLQDIAAVVLFVRISIVSRAVAVALPS